MSTSASGRRLLRRATGYLVASAICLVVSRIYLAHSHGLSSPYMELLWAWPLAVGSIGVVVSLVWQKAGAGELPQAATTSWRCIAATLTLGSFVRGVLEIADATSSFLVVYDVAATVLLVVCAGSLALAFARRRRHLVSYDGNRSSHARRAATWAGPDR